VDFKVLEMTHLLANSASKIGCHGTKFYVSTRHVCWQSVCVDHASVTAWPAGPSRHVTPPSAIVRPAVPSNSPLRHHPVVMASARRTNVIYATQQKAALLQRAHYIPSTPEARKPRGMRSPMGEEHWGDSLALREEIRDAPVAVVSQFSAEDRMSPQLYRKK